MTAIWVLPFFPSPLRDDGYDTADYTAVHPSYGTMGDFKHFLREAHARGIRVITELVLNHTSDQHPWFQRARRAKPGSHRREFYVWSDDPTRYKDARIIFKDFESSNWTWDPAARAYYWHRFYFPPAGPELRPPGKCKRKCSRPWISGFPWAWTGCASTRCPICFERDGHQLRKPAGNPCLFKKKSAPTSTPANTRTACCWPKPISGRRTPPPTSGTAT